MFSANTKRLTGRSARNEVDASVFAPIYRSDVRPRDRPMPNMFDAFSTVMQDCLNRVPIPLDHQVMLEARARETKSQASAACKKFDAPHDLLPTRPNI